MKVMRNELIGAPKGRVFGETVDTVGLANQQLLQMQNEKMRGKLFLP